MSDFIIHIIMMSMVILICYLPKVKEQKNSIKLRDILALCINSQIYCSWIQAWFFSFDEHKRSSLLQSPASEDYKQQRDADQVTIRNSTIHVLNKDITQHKVWCTSPFYSIWILTVLHLFSGPIFCWVSLWNKSRRSSYDTI